MASSKADFLEAFARYARSPQGARGAANFERAVRESDMRYAGEPLDVTFWPFALEAADLAALRETVEAAARLLERATRAFLEDPEMQAEYGWPPERLALVRHDPGYPLALPCARFDSYWDGREPRFFESNTDGTSGMTNVERVTEIFLRSPGFEPLKKEFGVRAPALCARVLEALLSCWGHFREGRPELPAEPRIAILDWREVRTRAEFGALRRYFEERGLRATVADPRDLRYDGRRLADAEGPIDLIYRRLVSTEWFARRAEVAAVEAAFLDRAVCLVGSFRSDIAFDKRLFALLHDPRFARHFGEDERALAARHFARTWVLRPGAIAEIDGRRCDLARWALEARGSLVLKPCALYEGRGVLLGAETPEERWRAAIEDCADGLHVLQERVAAPRVMELESAGVLGPGRPAYLSLGEFVFGGRLAGFIARVSSALVLSAEDDERLLPVVIVGA
jgi:hypothetical protein